MRFWYCLMFKVWNCTYLCLSVYSIHAYNVIIYMSNYRSYVDGSYPSHVLVPKPKGKKWKQEFRDVMSHKPVGGATYRKNPLIFISFFICIFFFFLYLSQSQAESMLFIKEFVISKDLFQYTWNTHLWSKYDCFWTRKSIW